ncbi:MAG TPA: FAD-dependent oxidoreductase [Thermoanaerobaculaceae bacterium]|nr:FAD-dependent oxidoreductase [Thermoanaerobaculaceae bacterium]
MTNGERGRAVVVGSGLAGLACAVELAGSGWATTVVTAGRAGRDGATHRVHGLAPWILLTAPWVRGDSPERFLADLARRGQGLERTGLAEVLAENAHAAARELIETLDLELLADEPVTLPGDEIARGLRCLPRDRHLLLAPLLRRCAELGVELRERTLASGLLLAAGRVVGLTAFGRGGGGPERILADAVVLACGGSASVFPVSTAPRWCRGSGLAVAGTAGALLHRPELTQALPVTATPPLFFPSSAALVTATIWIGERTLPRERDLETTTLEIARAGRDGIPAFLEADEGAREVLPPQIRASAGIAGGRRVALTVAQHHAIGGVAIDAWGRTSLAGLYACGEAAGGVQGRRRTMGTGLLEAAIFGTRAARAAVRDRARPEAGPAAPLQAFVPPLPADAEALERRLDELLRPLVVERPADAVARAIGELEGWPERPGSNGGPDEKCVLAAIRRQAAVLILGGSLGDGGRGA